jgi:hypothetical protein
MDETFQLKEGWADNNGIQLHYIQSNLPDPQGFRWFLFPAAWARPTTTSWNSPNWPRAPAWPSACAVRGKAAPPTAATPLPTTCLTSKPFLTRAACAAFA